MSVERGEKGRERRMRLETERRETRLVELGGIGAKVSWKNRAQPSPQYEIIENVRGFASIQEMNSSGGYLKKPRSVDPSELEIWKEE